MLSLVSLKKKEALFNSLRMDELLKDYDRSATVFRPTASGGFPYTLRRKQKKADPNLLTVVKFKLSRYCKS